MTDPILDLLQRFPNCRVTINSSTASRRPRPKEGDRRFFKTKGGWHVRRQQRREGCSVVRNGRPVFEWVREEAK